MPNYYSIFEQFDPDSAFLNERDYLHFLSSFPKINKKRFEYSQEQKKLYKLFLRFDAILYALKLNKFSNNKIEKRIKAHYSFLSQMVHPSKRGIEIFNPQEQMAYLNSIEQINTRNDNIELVALLYSGFLTCGFISLMDYVFLNAPKKFVKDFDVKKKLKKQIEKFYNFYNYFWFIFNDPHEYDKFQYCVSSIGTKKKSPKMSEIKNGDVPFNKDILARIDNLQKGWHNNTCGGYNPPF